LLLASNNILRRKKRASLMCVGANASLMNAELQLISLSHVRPGDEFCGNPLLKVGERRVARENDDYSQLQSKPGRCGINSQSKRSITRASSFQANPADCASNPISEPFSLSLFVEIRGAKLNWPLPPYAIGFRPNRVDAEQNLNWLEWAGRLLIKLWSLRDAARR
jgi:hypothetical protein